MMKKFLLGAVIFASMLIGSAWASDLSGKYSAVGMSPGNVQYKASVVIAKNGDVYNVSWWVDGVQAYSGVGLLKGNRLSVGWLAGSKPAVVVYEVANNQLQGAWSMTGSTKEFVETLTRE